MIRNDLFVISWSINRLIWFYKYHPKVAGKTAILYYITIGSYLLLVKQFSLSIGERVDLYVGDLLFIVLVSMVIYKIIKQDYPLCVWGRGINLVLFTYIVYMMALPFIGFLFVFQSIGVLIPYLRQFQMFLIFPITATLVEKNEIHVKQVAIILLITAFLNALVSIWSVNNLAKPIELINTNWGFRRAAGLYGEGIAWLGTSMAITFIFGSTTLFGNKVPNHISFAIMIFSGLSLILSVSITSLIMVIPVIVFVFMVLMVRQPTLRPLLPAATLLVLTPVLSVSDLLYGRVLNFLSLFSGDLGAVSSLNARLVRWSELLHIFVDKYFPFGTIIPYIYEYDAVADGYYISLILQGGIPLVTMYILLHMVLMFYGIREYFYSKSNVKDLSALVALSSMSVLLGSFTTAIMGYPPTSLLIWVIIGIGFGFFESRRYYVHV